MKKIVFAFMAMFVIKVSAFAGDESIVYYLANKELDGKKRSLTCGYLTLSREHPINWGGSIFFTKKNGDVLELRWDGTKYEKQTGKVRSVNYKPENFPYWEFLQDLHNGYCN